MKSIRLTLTFEQYKELLIWAQDHAQDSPEAAMLWDILYAKLEAMRRREDYTDALKPDAVSVG